MNILFDFYDDKHTFLTIEEKLKYSEKLKGSFIKWLCKYCENDIIPDKYIDNSKSYENVKIYGCLETKELYIQAIIDYISGMTDHFAIEIFNELITYWSSIRSVMFNLLDNYN